MKVWNAGTEPARSAPRVLTRACVIAAGTDAGPAGTIVGLAIVGAVMILLALPPAGLPIFGPSPTWALV